MARLDSLNPRSRDWRLKMVWVAMACGGVAAYLFWPDSAPAVRETTLSTAAVLLTIAAIGVIVYHHFALLRLRRGFRRAQEGLLEPVEPRFPNGTFLKSLITEYNGMMAALRTMFSTVEECQARVLKERNKINAILQSLPGALISISDELCITGINKPTEGMFGLGREQLIGINLFELLELNEHDREILRDAFLYKRPIQNQEISLSVNGAIRWFTLNMAFLSESEADMGAVITMQDVTDYHQLRDSVAIREKLVAMGQLAAGVAHELNTPLGNILGYSQLLRDEAREGKLADYAAIVADETKRCSRIVQDLLHYARRDQCSGDVCEINSFIRELVETFITCRLKRYNIDIQLDLGEDELLVDGSCGQLDIVLINLLLNAIQALEGVAEPRLLISACADSAGAVIIRVEDNGPGIPPELRARIFDPFFTTKGVGEGSGLGLAISQAMIVRRGGFIRYDVDYTAGARFVIRLPAVNPERVVA